MTAGFSAATVDHFPQAPDNTHHGFRLRSHLFPGGGTLLSAGGCLLGYMLHLSD